MLLFTLAPIWLPHWPACICTISLMTTVVFRPHASAVNIKSPQPQFVLVDTRVLYLPLPAQITCHSTACKDIVPVIKCVISLISLHIKYGFFLHSIRNVPRLFSLYFKRMIVGILRLGCTLEWRRNISMGVIDKYWNGTGRKQLSGCYCK